MSEAGTTIIDVDESASSHALMGRRSSAVAGYSGLIFANLLWPPVVFLVSGTDACSDSLHFPTMELRQQLISLRFH